MSGLRRMERDDSGAALLLALGFMTFFGLVVAALLSFVDTGFKANEVVQGNRQEGYAGEGGIEAAIAGMRYDRTVGVAGSTPNCPTRTFAGLAGQTVAVKCEPLTGSGVTTGGGGPTTAILTLGQHSPAEPGISRSSSATLKVRGDVVSNSTIEGGANAKLDVSGSKVYARGACSPTDMFVDVAAPGALCNLGPASVLPAFSDPNFAPTITAAPAAATVPSCTTENSLVTLSPGTYNDVSKLNALTGGGDCKKSLIHLQAGKYFFNFTNSGSHEWLINDPALSVVCGAKAWTDPGRATVLFPGGCNPAVDGVELYFGGDSRLFVEAAKGVEFCGPVGGNRVAVHGLKPNVATSAPTSVAATGFTPADRLPTTAVLGPGTPESASATLAGFAPPSGSAGAQLSGLTLRLTHSDVGNFGKAEVVISKGAKECDSVAVTQAPVSATWTYPVPSACASSADDLQQLKVVYTVTRGKLTGNPVPPTLTEVLTSVQLEVSWLPGGLVPQSGCVTAVGYTGGKSGGPSAPCALIKTDGSNGNLAIQGAVYAPLAALDINLPNVAAQFYVHGIVARTVRLGVPASSVASGPVISVPGSKASVQDREVDLIAEIDGVEVVRARIKFDDGNDGDKPGLTVTVARWSSAR